ncbi:MAG: methyltransferase domain-containing protein [Actinomycetota bacterium]|nr:methyltransferase domain-containing protein [Actinomycetota bacterium]
MTDAPSTAKPADRWRELLRSSAVPQEIIDASPEPDVSLEPARFRWDPEEDARQPVRPSRRRALEALPEGGSVLDVGVGGGASSLGLVPKAGLIVGVDPMEGMLESFEASAREAGVAARAVAGTWPEVAGEVEPADVAVCHHVIYRAMEVEDFVVALTERARHRVVMEVSDRSPLSALDPLWKAFHGLDRPDWSVADELQAVLVAMGLAVERQDMLLPPRTQEVTPELVAFSRRRLHVGPERDPDIEEWLRARQPAEHRVVALWWPGTAS